MSVVFISSLTATAFLLCVDNITIYILLSLFLSIRANLLRFHNTTHLSQSLTCLMACWTFSRLMSLASFSSVFSSIFNIDTLYWHSSTTTTSGCTARIVCSEGEQEQWARKIRHRVWESNRKSAAREEAQTKQSMWKRDNKITLSKIAMRA